MNPNLDPVYNSAYEAGKAGRFPPVGFKPIESFTEYLNGSLAAGRGHRPNLESFILSQHLNSTSRARGFDTLLYDEALRSGYIDGLDVLISSAGLLLADGAKVIITPEGHSGYLHGRKLESPSRLPAQGVTANFGLISTGLNVTFRAQDAAYALGFAVAIFKQYGIIVDNDQIPWDISSHFDFSKGHEGTERSVSFDVVPVLNQIYRTDSPAYLFGLGLWLIDKGIEGVNPIDLRHPAALAEFKAELYGRGKPDLTFGENFIKLNLSEPQPLSNIFRDNKFDAIAAQKRNGASIGRRVKMSSI